VLSCGHEIPMHPGELASLPKAHFCNPCTDAQRLARWERAERRRAARRRAC
jgi:hypothetical protein